MRPQEPNLDPECTCRINQWWMPLFETSSWNGEWEVPKDICPRRRKMGMLFTIAPYKENFYLNKSYVNTCWLLDFQRMCRKDRFPSYVTCRFCSYVSTTDWKINFSTILCAFTDKYVYNPPTPRNDWVFGGRSDGLWICLQGCHNKVPKSGCLNTREIDCRAVLQAGSLKSRGQQGDGPHEGSRRGFFLPSARFCCMLSIFGISWLIHASLQSHGHLFLVCFHATFLPRVSVCVQISSLHRDISHIG